MTLNVWLQTVAAVMLQHPEWLKDTQGAIQTGLIMRLEEEQDARARSETALSVCFDALGGLSQLPEEHRDMVRKVVKESKKYGGTPWAEGL